MTMARRHHRQNEENYSQRIVCHQKYQPHYDHRLEVAIMSLSFCLSRRTSAKRHVDMIRSDDKWLVNADAHTLADRDRVLRAL